MPLDLRGDGVGELPAVSGQPAAGDGDENERLGVLNHGVQAERQGFAAHAAAGEVAHRLHFILFRIGFREVYENIAAADRRKKSKASR